MTKLGYHFATTNGTMAVGERLMGLQYEWIKLTIPN